MLRDGTLTHLPEDGQHQLWHAVRKATIRPIGQKRHVRMEPSPTTTPTSARLVACTLALHGAMTSQRDPTRQQEAWY